MQTKFLISGVECPACKKIIEKRVKNIEGVKEADLDLKEKTVSVISDQKISSQQISESLIGLHYSVEKELI